MMDRERFLRNLLGLTEVFGESELSEFRILAYAGALEPFSDDRIERAMNEAARSLRFFPKPVELVELIQGKQEDKALSAWEQLQQAVSRAGAYQSVLFEDPKISRVIKILGGWEAVCLWPIDELQFRRHEFLQAYKALPDVPSPPETLGGISDRSNAALGYPEAAPVFIGREPRRPALPGPADTAATQPDDGERIPIREVLKALDGKLFGLSSKSDPSLKH